MQKRVSRFFAPYIPVHSLGMSQIIAYGVMFYAFAQLKQPLSVHFNVTQTEFLGILSLSLIVQAVLAPQIGKWTDKYSALWVMVAGFSLGGIGIATLTLNDSFIWLCGVMMMIGLATGMSSYEIAFSAAVQLDEPNARANISYITFYGAIASSVIWISIGVLLPIFGLFGSLMILASLLWAAAIRMAFLARRHTWQHQSVHHAAKPFSFASLRPSERRATWLLGIAGGLEYLAFSAAAFMWISVFTDIYGQLALAIFLASIYGPFQLVGRVIEMLVAHRYDARLTGAVASALVPISLWVAGSNQIAVSIIAMMLFGMGHGVLTVSSGFITNLYFRAEFYGRAKGLTAVPRALGLATGPFLGSWIYTVYPDQFLSILSVMTLISGASFWALLTQPPTNLVHLKN